MFFNNFMFKKINSNFLIDFVLPKIKATLSTGIKKK